jgi:DNA-binding NtrC family response regulator
LRKVVLVVDGELSRRQALTTVLPDSCSTEPDTLVRDVQEIQPALVILGARADESPGVLLLANRLRLIDRRLPVIVVASDDSENFVVEAMRAGVKDYFREPFLMIDLLASVRRWLAAVNARGDVRVSSPPASGSIFDTLVGESDALRAVREYIPKLAATDASVLITGETGTGKERVALMIHALSRRRHRRLMSINCAAIPDGLLESELFGYESGSFTGATGSKRGLLQLADGGTVFLDEIGDMGPSAQAKILRAVETREIYRLGGQRGIPVDVRLIAATNQDLERAIAEGRFRKDLYFRLEVARIHLPPLRERREDIQPLLDYYRRDLNRRYGTAVQRFSDDACARLSGYDWPGNVRELRNLVEAVFIDPPSATVSVENFPEAFRRRIEMAAVPVDERARLLAALRSTNWNKSRAAAQLCWSRMTLYRKLAKYRLVRTIDRQPDKVLATGGAQRR